LEENLAVPLISANSFQLTVPQLQQNKDVVEQLEKLIETVKSLRQDLENKNLEVAELNKQIVLYEKLYSSQETQIANYKQLVDNSDKAFLLLKEKSDNNEKAIGELKTIVTTLEKQVATEKKRGNWKLILGGLAVLLIKAL
jgi:DNA repair exonuclease SbcCD ATPase subunit